MNISLFPEHRLQGRELGARECSSQRFFKTNTNNSIWLENCGQQLVFNNTSKLKTRSHRIACNQTFHVTSHPTNAYIYQTCLQLSIILSFFSVSFILPQENQGEKRWDVPVRYFRLILYISLPPNRWVCTPNTSNYKGIFNLQAQIGICHIKGVSWSKLPSH